MTLARVDGRMKPFQSRILTLSLCVVAAGLGTLRAEDTVQVAEPELKKAAVTKVTPEVPPLARQLHLNGRVEVEVTVASDGSVERTQAKSGNPVLTASAANALKKWKFTPFTADGKPAKAVGSITFDFK
jgi:TonB family protein